MNWIIDKLGSTDWWVSVVIVGIAVNLLSTLVQKAFDRLRAGVSKRYNESKSREAKRRKELIQRLKTDKEQLAAFRSRLLARKMDVLEYMLVGVFMILLGIQLGGSQSAAFPLLSSIAFTVGNMTWLMGLSLGIKSFKDSDIASAVEENT